MQLYPFMYALSTAALELQGQGSCNEDAGPEAENIYYLAVCRESWWNPGIDDGLVQYLFILIPEKVRG